MSVTLPLSVLIDNLASEGELHSLCLRACQDVVETYCSGVRLQSSRKYDLCCGFSGRKQLAAGVRCDAGAAVGLVADICGDASFTGVASGGVASGSVESERSGVEVQGAIRVGGVSGPEGSCSGGCGEPVGAGSGVGESGAARGEDRSGVVVGRGKHWERNQVWKEARKARKVKRKAAAAGVPEWRRGAGPVVEGRDSQRVVQGVVQSAFAGCSEAVRQELRDSRARMLIAQNELRAKKAEKAVERVDSNVGFLMEVSKVVSMVNGLKKKAKDSEIGGWACTVADVIAESVAKSAPSTIPSLESVGAGRSLSVSSGDAKVQVQEARKAEYLDARKKIEDMYDNMPYFRQEDMDDDFIELERAYSDVIACEDGAIVVQQRLNAVIDALSAMNLGSAKMEVVGKIVYGDKFSMPY